VKPNFVKRDALTHKPRRLLPALLLSSQERNLASESACCRFVVLGLLAVEFCKCLVRSAVKQLNTTAVRVSLFSTRVQWQQFAGTFSNSLARLKMCCDFFSFASEVSSNVEYNTSLYSHHWLCDWQVINPMDKVTLHN